MEETKTTKSNSIIEKFKNLKAPYRIGIIAVIVAVVVYLLFFRTPSSPLLDLLAKDPTEAQVEAQLGKDFKVPYGRSWCRVYKNVKLFGLNGELEINFFKDRDSSTWTYRGDKSTVSATIEKLVKKLDRLYGESEYSSYTYRWHDKRGHDIRLEDYGDRIYLHFS